MKQWQGIYKDAKVQGLTACCFPVLHLRMGQLSLYKDLNHSKL